MFNGEPGPASAGASRNVVRSSSISGEICGSQQAGGGAGTTTAKKRRSSLGAKMVAIVGLTQWSKSTLQLPQPEGATKKLRSNIRRSTETGIAVEMRSRVTARAAGSLPMGAPTVTAPRGTCVHLPPGFPAETPASPSCPSVPCPLLHRYLHSSPPPQSQHPLSPPT
uniref:Regulating synaptic membrane exocytosis protein 3 n=1 Tax=Mus musculus TaxID=10090 RepID=Q3UVX9_MOUSE|nr:unnamed protein product [Mus musculus]